MLTSVSTLQYQPLVDAFGKVKSFFLTLVLLVSAFASFSRQPVVGSTSLLHKRVLSVFSFLIVLRVI